MSPENRLDAIRLIIGHMNGTFMTGGKYFIPFHKWVSYNRLFHYSGC